MLHVTSVTRQRLTEGKGSVNRSCAQGPHLIPTEERARLGAAEMAHRVFQVRVDLNLQTEAEQGH